MPPSKSRAAQPFPILWAGLLAGGILLFAAWLQAGRAFGWDEFEFARATQWVREGRVPYRDFWEHHAPLQWFLLAPFKDLLPASGSGTILGLRWLQALLWVGAFTAGGVLLRRERVPAWAVLGACALPLLTPLFTLWAVEFRPDTWGTALLLLGLFAWRTGRTRFLATLAGAAFAAAPMANLRMGPLAVGAFLLCLAVRPVGRRWGLHPRWTWMLLGAAAPVLLWGAQLASTGSLAQAYRYVVADNAWFNGQFRAQGQELIWTLPFRERDPGGVLLVLGAAAATWTGLRGLARPGLPAVLALLQLAQAALVTGLSVHYPYHLQSFLLLAAVQTGLQARPGRAEEERALFRRIAGAVSAGLLVFGAYHLAVARAGRTLGFQRAFMGRLEAELAPDDRVLDGVGFDLRHEPAATAWFLPTLARRLTLRGRLPAYSPRDLLSRPPGAVVVSGRLRGWLPEWPGLTTVLVRHYLPVDPFLLKPGLSARLDPAGPPGHWIVPATGTYRVHAVAELAGHPWFTEPLAFFELRGPSHPRIQVGGGPAPDGLPSRLAFKVNGAPRAVPSGTLDLRRGEELIAESLEPVALGVFLLPASTPRAFQGCRPGDSLDANLNGIWALP